LATVNIDQLTDIITLVYGSMSLYTSWHSLRYWGSHVRIVPGAPVISATYLITNSNISSFASLLCH